MREPTERLGGLQIARAVAALTVAYYHSYISIRGAFPEASWHPIPWLAQWGYLGVNFFFAISGYVICLVASRPSFSIGSFATRRVFRLYPMYWVVMGVVACMIAAGKYRAEPLGHFLYSMTLLPQQGPSAYDVSWTLEHEFVFYAIAAVTVPIAGIGGLAFTLASLAAAAWFFGNPWSFHIVSTIQADFLAGVIVFLARDRIAQISSLIQACCGLLILVISRTHDFPFSIPVSMSLLLAAMVQVELAWNHAPARWMVAAGDASYSIYLLHYVVFYWSAVASVRLFDLPQWACEPWRYATILACCLISYATWRLIERPFIRLGSMLSNTKNSILPAGKQSEHFLARADRSGGSA